MKVLTYSLAFATTIWLAHAMSYTASGIIGKPYNLYGPCPLKTVAFFKFLENNRRAIIWRDGSIAENKRDRFSYVGNILTIKPVEAEDAGEYAWKCYTSHHFMVNLTFRIKPNPEGSFEFPKVRGEWFILTIGVGVTIVAIACCVIAVKLRRARRSRENACRRNVVEEAVRLSISEDLPTYQEVIDSVFSPPPTYASVAVNLPEKA